MHITSLFYGLLLFCLSTTYLGAQNHLPIKKTINEQWKFDKGNPENAADLRFDDSSWGQVNIPHTWNNMDATDDVPGYHRGVCWYRKTFNMEAGQAQKTLIYFEGANQITDVYLNGTWVGNHKGGYTRFHFDITPHLKFGQPNVLAVKVDNSYNENIPPLSADFTFFGGIYRDVFLMQLNNVHFSMDDHSTQGVFITTPQVSKEMAEVEVKTLLSNASSEKRNVNLITTLMDKAGNKVSERSQKIRLDKDEKNTSVLTHFTVKEPKLWSPDEPYLYKVFTQIKDAKTGTLLDESLQPLGLRWFKFDPDKGFFLNGEYMKLIGTNRHQDYLGKGNALTDEMHLRDVHLLKEMGGNFLRIAHYPQDPTILEACDKLGILASVEIPIVNAITESQEFTDNSLFMAEEMVKQNFNHPSLIIWAYMNEVLLRLPFDPNTEKERYREYADNVQKLASKIEEHIRILDPHRYTMIANHGAIESYKNAGITDIPMILGWNLYQGWYS